MDPQKKEGGCHRDQPSAAGEMAHSGHFEDVAGEHRDVPVSWVIGKKKVDIETTATDLKGTPCGPEFSTNCGAEELGINIPCVQMPTGVLKDIMKDEEKDSEVGD